MINIEENLQERIVKSSEDKNEVGFEIGLRPKKLEEYVGQEQIKNNLAIFLQAAKKRNQPIEHVLLYGPPGLGKTTLAYIIASEMNANIKITSGPALERGGDLAAILTSLSDGDVLFIDEIHRLNKNIEEILYPAMEDFCLDLIIGKGPSAKTLRLNLPKFTLIGATTKFGAISSPLRDRFGNVYRLDFYNQTEIESILSRSARILNIEADKEGLVEVAKRSRQTPRIANRLLKRVRDYAEVKADNIITPEIASEALNLLNIDEFGLDEIDRRILTLIIEKFNGGPVGLNTISAAISEELETVEDVYEPYLLQKGFINRTPRGRVATLTAYQHLKYKQ